MPTPSTMLERIAEAISVSFHEEGYIEGQSEPELWDEFMKAAREVLRAMRDPSPTMCDAPTCTDAWVNGVNPTGEEAEAIWRAMIDAILNEEKS